MSNLVLFTVVNRSSWTITLDRRSDNPIDLSFFTLHPGETMFMGNWFNSAVFDVSAYLDPTKGKMTRIGRISYDCETDSLSSHKRHSKPVPGQISVDFVQKTVYVS